MADNVTIKLENAADLKGRLKALREEVAIKATRSSTRRIAAYLSRMLAAVTPTRSGKLRRNEAVRSKYVRSRGVTVAKVVVNTVGKADNPRNAFYWRFLEGGFTTRKSKKGRQEKPVRKITGSRFASNLIKGAQSRIASMFFEDIEKAVRRAERRASK